MRTLAALGCGFDCASAKEMADVLAMGVPAERIIFAHPCKRPTDLDYAVAANVRVCAAAPVATVC
jgi:ornithine decarboxylase